jgi:formylglycine-generating enzyme required for sulfatase activity
MFMYKWLSDIFFTYSRTLTIVVPLLILASACSTSEEFTEAEETGQQTTEEALDFSEFTEEIPGTGEAIELAPIPGGSFLMGADDQQHEVVLDPFYMSKHEITWDLYRQFAAESPDDLQAHLQQVDFPGDAISLPSPPYTDMSMGMGFEGYPAVSITQYNAMMFTKWLTAKTGTFYRLPTEAEWEYACRAGQNEQYSPPENLDNYAWHRGNSNDRYHLVGSLEPNEFGLYDMLGNVAEWTLDQYHVDYIERLEDDPAVNPWFKPTELYPRAVRGGSWRDTEETASCLHRRGSTPNWKRDDPQFPKSLWWHTNAPFLGFRVVVPKNQPQSTEEMEEYWIEEMQDYF